MRCCLPFLRPAAFPRSSPPPISVGFVRCFNGTMQPSDSSSVPRQLRLLDFLSRPGIAQATAECWNWFSAGDQLRDRGEPSLIAGITRQIIRDVAVDPTRVYIAGLSAGGAAAAIMGLAYPDLYAAIGVHSGLACGAAKDMPSAFAAMRQGGSRLTETAKLPLPTIVFHGDRDHTVNPVNGDQVIAQSKAAAELHLTISRGQSAGGINYTQTIQTDGSGRPILEQWLLHGAGHAWSGGSPAGSYTDPRGPDASREMLRFFRENQRNPI